MTPAWQMRVHQSRDRRWLIADLRVEGQRFRSRIDLHKLRSRLMRDLERYRVRGEVGFSLKKMWKKVKKTARKVVKHKVWKVAEKVTKLGALLPPPYGPALAATHASMKTTRAIVAAKKAAKRGDHKTAKKLLAAASKYSKKFSSKRPSAREAGPLYLALV